MSPLPHPDPMGSGMGAVSVPPPCGGGSGTAPARTPCPPRDGGSGTALGAAGVGIRVALRVAVWLAGHWLALANSLFLAVVAISAAVPGITAVGLTRLAEPLFASYRLICHQLPDRSFFLFGHPMAMCQRNVAIYGSIALAGLVFALVRNRVEPLPWRWYLVSLLPIAVDGFTQLFGLRESNWELRLSTGALFGVATVVAAYPRLDTFARRVLASAKCGGTILSTSHFAPGIEVPNETP